MRRWMAGAGALGFVAAIQGCGGTPTVPADTPAPQSEIARIHRSKCGNCHTRVEPGQRTREQLEAAFPRHRRRVHLSEDQWNAMVDYLAAQSATATSATTKEAQPPAVTTSARTPTST